MDDKQKWRTDVLLDWRDRARARGYEVPTEADTMLIAAGGVLFPDGVDVARAEPWRPTLEQLLRLIRRNMPDPISMLADDLWEPVLNGHGPGPSGSSSGEAPREPDPVRERLLRWYHAEPADGPRRNGLTLAVVERLARNAGKGKRAASDVRPHLPRDLAHLAEEIAAVIGEPPADDTPSGSPVPDPSTGPERGAAPSPSLDDLDLAPYRMAAPDCEPGEVTVASTATGFHLSWALAAGGPVIIYRVVYTDGRYTPGTPQEADELTRTDQTSCEATGPFPNALRHVQVWCHAGGTRDEAAAAEPFLHAAGIMIIPVSEPRIRLDGEKVVGNWRTPYGARRVRIERAERRVGSTRLTFAEIRSGSENRTGFSDSAIELDRRYVYRLSVEVEIGDHTRVSDGIRLDVEVPVPLTPITDLLVERSAGGGVDLTWSTPHPALEVFVYRAAGPPTAAFAGGSIPREVFEKKCRGLGEVLDDDPESRDGTSRMTNVAWPVLDVDAEAGPGEAPVTTDAMPPVDAAHAYFTPVTLLNDRVAVGPSQMLVNLPGVTHLRIVERAYKQVMTFEWPVGAHSVAVARLPRVPPGPPAAHAAVAETAAEDHRRVAEALDRSREFVGHDEYVRVGGKAFTRLPPGGCRLVVAPVSHHKRQRHVGEAGEVDYPGLLRLKYGLAIVRDAKEQPATVYVTIVAEQEGVEDLQFTLVAHPHRLPLHIGDKGSEQIEMQPTSHAVGEGGKQFRATLLPLLDKPGPAAWAGSVAGQRGFLRLFVRTEMTVPRVALLDPPVARLRLGVPGEPGQRW